MEQQNEYSNEPLSVQGNAAEQEDSLGGTTNLSLEQLKATGVTSNFSESNPNGIADADDLNEIRAGDSLGEPDPEDEDLNATVAGDELDDLDLDNDTTETGDDESDEFETAEDLDDESKEDSEHKI